MTQEKTVEYALISKDEILKMILLANQICSGAKVPDVRRPGKSADVLCAAEKLRKGLTGFWDAEMFGQVEVVSGNEYHLRSEKHLDVGMYALVAVQDMFRGNDPVH